MTDLVVWTGPVGAFQVPGATVPGARELFIGCYGDRQPHCPTIGTSLMFGLPALLAKAHMTEEQLDGLFFGAFSAGGSVVKRLLSNANYRKATTAVHLADATYTSGWVDKANRIPPAIAGFVEYAVDVIEGPGDKLFIATASPNPNYEWASGIENLQAMRRAIEERTGQQFQRVEGLGIDKEPEYAYRLGNVIFGEYSGASNIGHGHTILAGQIWQNIINPWLDKGKGPIDQPGGLPPPGPGNGPVTPPILGEPESWEPPGPGGVIAAMAGAVVGFLAVRRIMR